MSFSHGLKIPNPKKACGQRDLIHSPLTPSIVIRGTHPRAALSGNLMGKKCKSVCQQEAVLYTR